MRWIALLIILAALAFALGWWNLRDTEESIEIIIDKEEVQEDVEEAAEAGRELLDDARTPTEEEPPSAESEPPKTSPAGALDNAGS